MTANSGLRYRMPSRFHIVLLVATVVAALGGILQVGPAGAAVPAPTPTVPAAGKKANTEHARPLGVDHTRPSKSTAKTVADCSGALAGGVIHTCVVGEGDTHTYSVTTTKPQESVLFRLAVTQSGGVDMRVEVSVSDADPFCYFEPGPNRCVFPDPGIHTLTLNSYAGPGSYKLSAIGLADAPCKTLTTQDLAAGSAGISGQLVEGQFGDCFAFSGTAGDRLRFGVAVSTAQVFDAAGGFVCSIEFTDLQSCELSGTGPYRAFVTKLSGVDTGYTFHLVKLNSPTGCAVLPVAQFGDPGTAVANGQLDLGRMTCRTVTAAAGRHWIQSSGGSLNRTIYAQDGREVCAAGSDGMTCILPTAGAVTILFENRDTPAGVSFGLSMVPLATSAGCTPIVGTRWDLPLLQKTARSPLSLDCQPIDAVAGERILARQLVNADGHFVSIIDGAGANACEEGSSYDGCLLKGSGPFRVLSGAVLGDADYLLDIGRLSDPIGCTPAQLSTFNQTPPTAPAGSRCRTLTVDAATKYVIDDGTGSERGVYGLDGVVRCTELPNCELPAGKYTIVASASTPVSIFPLTSTTGCVAQPADTYVARKGELASAAQYDCVTLSSPTGAEVIVTEPTGQSNTDGEIRDVNGGYVCSWGLVQNPSVCELSGPGPYRALIRRDKHDPENAYSLAVPRIDLPATCGALPQRDFSTTSGTAVALTPGRFATCFAVPANAHSANEAFQYSRTGTAGTAQMIIRSAGEVNHLCAGEPGAARFTSCPMTAGRTYVALFVGGDVAANYQVARRDVTSTAKGCSAVSSSTIGATAGTGSIADGAALRCYKLLSAPTDQFVVNTRGAASIGAHAFRPNGDLACTTYGVVRCPLIGSTGYQVVVWTEPTAGPGGSYKLETARLSTAAGPAPECVKVPSAAYGFGPLTGEVNTTKTMNCVTFQLGKNDRVEGAAVNAITDGPVPHFYARTAAGDDNCRASQDPTGDFYCDGNSSATVAEVVLLGLPETQTSLKYKASATCQQPLCGGAIFGVTTAAPANGAVGTTVTVTLKGSSLHPRDVVRLTAAGKPTIAGTIRSVTADRTTSVYAFSLAGAPLGVRNVVVDSFAGSSVTLPNAFTVLGAAPTATKAPVLFQTAQVNHTVAVTTGTWSPTCTSYGYQWYSGGAAIAGATHSTLLLPASTANKTLYAAVTCTLTGRAPGRALSNSVTVRP